MKNLEITASTAFLYEIIQRIETISRRDPGGRGLAAHVTQEQLLPAARELMTGTRIVIVTGFCIRAVMAGETDGPPGALALADALARLGKEVLMLTDDFSQYGQSAIYATYNKAADAFNRKLATPVLGDIARFFGVTPCEAY